MLPRATAWTSSAAVAVPTPPGAPQNERAEANEPVACVAALGADVSRISGARLAVNGLLLLPFVSACVTFAFICWHWFPIILLFVFCFVLCTHPAFGRLLPFICVGVQGSALGPAHFNRHGAPSSSLSYKQRSTSSRGIAATVLWRKARITSSAKSGPFLAAASHQIWASPLVSRGPPPLGSLDWVGRSEIDTTSLTFVYLAPNGPDVHRFSATSYSAISSKPWHECSWAVLTTRLIAFAVSVSLYSRVCSRLPSWILGP